MGVLLELLGGDFSLYESAPYQGGLSASLPPPDPHLMPVATAPFHLHFPATLPALRETLDRFGKTSSEMESWTGTLAAEHGGPHVPGQDTCALLSKECPQEGGNAICFRKPSLEQDEREASRNLPPRSLSIRAGCRPPATSHPGPFQSGRAAGGDGKGQGRCYLHSPADCWNVLLELYLLHWDLTNISLSLPVFQIKPLGSDHNTTPPPPHPPPLLVHTGRIYVKQEGKGQPFEDFLFLPVQGPRPA